MASAVIWSGVIGRWGDMDGVWTDPVTAQVMMTFLDFLMFISFQVAELNFVGV
ncbi:hypothetical protein SPH9361_04749 [Sphingobium sp. CECT 9361]|nr:hypothetical protein SPH9361_04749 [Sphingobium sp. CECT 9361]